MAEPNYSHDIRILACLGCGAPLRVDVAGGLTTCGYCGATHALAGRDEREDRARAASSRGATVSESERIARLREQADRDEPLPESIAALLDGGRLPLERAKALLPEWKLLRPRVQDGDFLASERLFHLTRLILPHVDDRTRRAFLESAIEVLPDHRHRHVLRCELAISAARAGEVEAAEAWLDVVDRRPVDLLMDSAARAASATIAAARRNGAVVLAELGERPGDVPCSRWYVGIHALLRAAGLELVGRVDEAVKLLMETLEPAAMHDAAALLAPMLVAPRAQMGALVMRAEARLAELQDRTKHAAFEMRVHRDVLIAAVVIAIVSVIAVLAVLQLGWVAPSDLEFSYRDGDGAHDGNCLVLCGIVELILLMPVGATGWKNMVRYRRELRELKPQMERACSALDQLRGRSSVGGKALLRRPPSR